MSLWIGEHGEILLYGIVGVLMVAIICKICFSKWSQISPQYNVRKEQNNEKFQKDQRKDYPVIESDDVIYAEYKQEDFDVKNYLKATDYDGTDITSELNVYGNVNVFQKGVYRLRCVVVSKNQLISTKKINVIVE
ncbi:MAG: hypothetical protein K6G85_05510 [Eubacterium sp.]|nr:hypothetical protein [Eubacterium sp.]